MMSNMSEVEQTYEGPFLTVYLASGTHVLSRLPHWAGLSYLKGYWRNGSMSKLQGVLRTLVPGNLRLKSLRLFNILFVLCSGSGHVFICTS